MMGRIPPRGSTRAKRPRPVRQGNESRLTPQRAQYVEQVFGVPSGALAAALDGSFVGALAHQVEGEVADHGHVLGPMTGAQALSILVESYVEDPVQVVFDAPMASCSLRKGCGRQRTGGDVGSPFGLDLVAALDAAFDDGDGGELRKAGRAWVAALGGVPVDNVGDRMGADLEAAVLLADCLDLLDLSGRRGLEIAFDIGMQGRLVVLDG